ncbi:Cys-tRNA(Pro)/Cys-tRNA(Cys) deacylase [Prolixibacter bellariivorans]|uniref:Cys-tRNA(Pro)/Cys-tRNA(Cys) deacylase n=1 Tax=Prolixibacter bellariivorans TaxID=314319 RepID=A0A5M4AYS3_9BACT|nr:Cys-tRNA(Pro) deacylase [Prolixibacter bellariivorans]GET32746.1 Cys-tRNA(Pro)/Cys-tRNA(Cys) deacylase [Prolixibacter bellariivorans]
MKKTNAARILDRLKINYKLVTYTVDENDLSAEHLAETAGLPVEKVYKTLVARGDRNGIFVCVVPGAASLDLKKAAKASGNKKVAMVLMKELEPLTGYIRGGCSPLGMKKNYPVFVDESALEQEEIFISAGQRGLQLHLTPSDLQKATGAQVVSLT